MGRFLTPDEINMLIRFHENTQHMLTPRTVSAFTKEQTIEILNAVTDLKNTTADGKWKITYKNNNANFFVKPVSGFVPCGNFNTEAVISRLEL